MTSHLPSTYPGIDFRFSPKYRSGYTLLSTSAAKTVVGMQVGYQPFGLNWVVEMISPVSATLAEDCKCQLSLSKSTSRAKVGFTDVNHASIALTSNTIIRELNCCTRGSVVPKPAQSKGWECIFSLQQCFIYFLS